MHLYICCVCLILSMYVVWGKEIEIMNEYASYLVKLK